MQGARMCQADDRRPGTLTVARPWRPPAVVPLVVLGGRLFLTEVDLREVIHSLRETPGNGPPPKTVGGPRQARASEQKTRTAGFEARTCPPPLSPMLVILPTCLQGSALCDATDVVVGAERALPMPSEWATSGQSTLCPYNESMMSSYLLHDHSGAPPDGLAGLC